MISGLWDRYDQKNMPRSRRFAAQGKVWRMMKDFTELKTARPIRVTTG